MVLCAGLGTRLLPLTSELPKPLLPVGDRPALLYITEQLVACNVDDLALNTHHLSEKFGSVVSGLPFKTKVTYEPEILGTAGGIARCARLLPAGPLLVWNGDILTQAPPAQLVKLAESSGICLGFSRRLNAEGTLGLDLQDNVVRLRGERFGAERTSVDYVGILALGRSVLAELPEHGCLIADFVLPRLRRGFKVRALEVTDCWTDLGSLAGYLEANVNFAKRAANREKQSFVASGARVGPGVEVDASVVGSGAVVSGDGALNNSVVWPGARARAPLESSIVMTDGSIVRVP